MLDRLPEPVLLLVLQSLASRHSDESWRDEGVLNYAPVPSTRSRSSSEGAEATASSLPLAANSGLEPPTLEAPRAYKNINLKLSGKDLVRVSLTCKAVYNLVFANEDDLFRRAYEVDFLYRNAGYRRWKERFWDQHGPERPVQNILEAPIVFCAWEGAPIPRTLGSPKQSYIVQALRGSVFETLNEVRLEGDMDRGAIQKYQAKFKRKLLTRLDEMAYEFRGINELLACAVQVDRDFWNKPPALFRIKFVYTLGRAVYYIRRLMQELVHKPSEEENRQFLLHGLFIIEAVLSDKRSKEFSPYTLFPWLQSLLPDDLSSNQARSPALVALIMDRLREARDAKRHGYEPDADWTHEGVSFPSTFMEKGIGLPLIQNACLMYMLRTAGFRCKMTNSPMCVYIRIETDEGPLFAEARGNTLWRRAEMEMRMTQADHFPSAAFPGRLRTLDGGHDYEMLLRTGRNLFRIISESSQGLNRSLQATLVLKMLTVIADCIQLFHLGPAEVGYESVNVEEIICAVFIQGTSRIFMP